MRLWKDMMILFKRAPGSDYQMWIIAEVPDSTYEKPITKRKRTGGGIKAEGKVKQELKAGDKKSQT